jgi:hypothetical protein
MANDIQFPTAPFYLFLEAYAIMPRWQNQNLRFRMYCR